VHAAPPVRVSLGRSRAWIALMSIAAGLAAANLVAWAMLQLGWPLVAAGTSLAAAISALASGAWAWRGQAPGTLQWDGARWLWAGLEGDAQVAVDLNHWMLLRFEAPPGMRCWIAASRVAASGPWSDLRAALYSRRPADRSDAPPA